MNTKTTSKTTKIPIFEINVDDIKIASEKIKTLNNTEESTPVGKICGNVYETKQYESFSFIDANRDVSRARINKLKKEILKDGLLVPIIVNTLLEIIDGQGRFYALKELNLEILYIIRNTRNVHIAPINNTGTKWKNNNWSNMWCIEGENQEHYQYYDTLLKKYKIRHNELSSLCIGENAFSKKVKDIFNNGEMIISNSKRIEIEKSLDFLFIELDAPIDFKNERKVQRTIFHLLKQPNFDKLIFTELMKNITYRNHITSPEFLSLPQPMLSNAIIKRYNRGLDKSLKINKI
jgi:hypothetical protein